MGTIMNFIYGLHRRLARRPGQRAGGLRRLWSRKHDQHGAGANATAPVPFDQVERLNDAGASLESLLEMNRVQGW
jgi:hypothetical protein